jgi:hypothetical protein
MMGRVTREITESKDFGWDPALWVVLDLDVIKLIFVILKVPSSSGIASCSSKILIYNKTHQEIIKLTKIRSQIINIMETRC